MFPSTLPHTPVDTWMDVTFHLPGLPLSLQWDPNHRFIRRCEFRPYSVLEQHVSSMLPPTLSYYLKNGAGGEENIVSGK